MIVTDGTSASGISPALAEVLAAAALDHLRDVHRLGGKWEPGDAATYELLAMRAQETPGAVTELPTAADLVHGGDGQTADDRLLTVAQVADRLTISETSVRRRTAEGEIPATKIGRLVRYRHSDIENYASGRGDSGA